ncbi:HigA family addiction module antitoxin [Herbaspirillum camelliae]|uniref:HigA family addiction module antitoxin n=1 Tax=Herbaspirillum camelliae TaxID=1892903 RepID=UPI000949F357|nr:HigA family addiction module antitoxin [Herbaspirillum camelliae]
MIKNGMRAVHPGEILFEDYIKPADMSVRTVAMALYVPYGRLDAVIKGKRAINADMALRLERYFGSEAQGWLNLQTAYDLRIAKDLSSMLICSQN